MITYYADAERISGHKLSEELEIIQAHPFIDGLMQTIGGLLAVVNDHRQILAMSQGFSELLHTNDLAKMIGRRPGEMLNCVHANDMEGGCGTSQHCITCGAAIAMVSSLEWQKAVQQDCVIEQKINGEIHNLTMSIRSQPVRIKNRIFLLLFLTDISVQHRRAAIERSCFLDVNTMIDRLQELAENLPDQPETEKIAQMARQISQEVALQKLLLRNNARPYQIDIRKISLPEFIGELKTIMDRHPSAVGKSLKISGVASDLIVRSDAHLLSKILRNMIINAFESSTGKETVTLKIQKDEAGLTFSVHNKTWIPENIQLRVFQKNFSTKSQEGRGLGTYGMKLFGEEYLGGRISFESGEGKGTTFHFFHPLNK